MNSVRKEELATCTSSLMVVLIRLKCMMLKSDNSDKQFPRQEHYSVCTCSEPCGRYLYHCPPEKCPKSVKPAEVIANNLVPFMKYKGIDKTFQAIGGDSTNLNTGWEGGTMHWVKVKLKRKLNWLVCALHTTNY